MANLLESSATTATTTPGFYTNYLSNLANTGTEAAKAAQFVGAQPLQEKAFGQVEGAASAFKPQLESASNTLNQAATSANPLATATPYLQAAISDPSQAAAQYMTPYIRSVVDALGDTGARNIRQNLSPLATAGAVGTGQFGSKRGAEVLGQTMSNAERDILNAQATAMNTGYQNALNAAIQQNQIENQAGATSANAAATGQQNLTQAGAAQGALSKVNQELNLADINALSTLGQQQQTIAQNEQNYPLTKLSTLSGLMAGQTIPTTQTQTATGSPLSAMATMGSGAAALFQKPTSGGQSLFQQMTGQTSLGGLIPTGALDSAGKYIKDAYNSVTGGGSSTAGGDTGIPGVYYDSSSPSGYADYMGNPVSGTGSAYDPSTDYSPTEQDVLNSMTSNDYNQASDYYNDPANNESP